MTDKLPSATEELRRMLDERGVEWSTTKGCDSDSITTVHVDGRFGGTEWEAFELSDGTFQVTAGIYDELTSEQFIAVTLGGGERTCYVDCSISWDWRGASTTYEHELSCGHTVTTDDNEPPSYCPECGSRVIGG